MRIDRIEWADEKNLPEEVKTDKILTTTQEVLDFLWNTYKSYPLAFRYRYNGEIIRFRDYEE